MCKIIKQLIDKMHEGWMHDVELIKFMKDEWYKIV